MRLVVLSVILLSGANWYVNWLQQQTIHLLTLQVREMTESAALQRLWADELETRLVRIECRQDLITAATRTSWGSATRLIRTANFRCAD